MKRYNFYLTEAQDADLKEISKDGVTVTEHIRRAVDQYIEKKKEQTLSLSTSPSTK